MHIRPANVDDAPVLAQVHVDSARAAYGELVPESALRGYTYPRREEGFRRALAAGTEETYVAELGGEIVAILTIGAARDADLDHERTGEIWGIYVAPAHWRKGIGKRLVAQAEEMLSSRKCERAVLWVLEANQQARRFYEAMGYRSDGASKDIDWGTIVKAVRYARDLRPGRAADR